MGPCSQWVEMRGAAAPRGEIVCGVRVCCAVAPRPPLRCRLPDDVVASWVPKSFLMDRLYMFTTRSTTTVRSKAVKGTPTAVATRKDLPLYCV